jgi:serine/threonine-protein kinase
MAWGPTDFAPRAYVENHYEDLGEVIRDHATGLMWTKCEAGGLWNHVTMQEAVDRLNRTRLGGYDDWRRPTVPELMSLLEPERQTHDLYLHPIFEGAQESAWSADHLPDDVSPAQAWYVHFRYGIVARRTISTFSSIRAVRSCVSSA